MRSLFDWIRRLNPEQREALRVKWGYCQPGAGAETMIQVLKEHPELEHRTVVFLQEGLPDARISTAADMVARATLEAAWYAKAAFWAAVLLGVGTLAETVLFGILTL